MSDIDSYQFCHWPWSKVKISANGDTRNCCYHGPFVDIAELKDQWDAHPIFTDIRRSVSEGHPHELHCLGGGTCPYRNEQNRLRLYKPSDWCVPGQPGIMELDIPNTHCNIGGPQPNEEHPACIMCPRNTPNMPDGERFLEVLEIAKSYIPQLKELWLIGLGETFWQEYYLDILEKLNFFPYGEQIRYMTFSNGICINRSVQDTFFRRIPRSTVVVSLDAASQETYTRIRRLPVFDQIVNNIREFTLNPNRDPNRQSIGVTYNINMLNVHETEEMVQMWKDCSVSHIGFTLTAPTGSPELQPHIINEDNKEIFAEAERKIFSAAQKLGMNNVGMSSHLEPFG